MLEVNAPSTETVKARYHLATVPDDIAPDLDRRMRAHNDAEFEAWKEALKEELREEIRRENAGAAPAPKPSSGFPVAPGSVADIYALSPSHPSSSRHWTTSREISRATISSEATSLLWLSPT